MGKNLSLKHGLKLQTPQKKSGTDALKTTSRRALQKTVKLTEDLVGDKITDKITRTALSKSTRPLQIDEASTERPKEYIPPERWQQIINELRSLYFLFKERMEENLNLLDSKID